PIARGVLHDPAHQRAKIHADVPRLFGHERGWCHPRLRVYFQKNQFVPIRRAVETKIGAADAAAAESLVCAHCDIHCLFCNVFRYARWQYVIGTAGSIFRLVVIKGGARHDFSDAKRALAHDSNGELASRYEFFDHDGLAERPGFAAELTWWAVVALADNENTDTRAFIDWLHHVRRLHRVTHTRFPARDNNALGNRQSDRAENILRALLVHGKCGREHTRMCVGNAQQFEEALY